MVWRCRRGVRELDVLLTRFLDQGYEQLDADAKAAFERFLEVQDPTIMDWLFAKAEPSDDGIKDIVTQLQTLSGINK